MIMTLDDFSLRSSSATWPRFTSDPYIAAGFLHSDELSGSFSPREDRSPGTVQRGGACGVRGCQRPSLGRLTYEGLSAAYPAMTVA